MLKWIIVLAAGLTGGFGIATWQSTETQAPVTSEPVAVDLTEIKALRSRMEALEQQLENIQAINLQDPVENISSEEELAERAAQARRETGRRNAQGIISRRAERRQQQKAQRERQLKEAGFDPVTIDRIDDLEASARLQQLDARWEAQRKAMEQGDWGFFDDGEITRKQLESELGTDAYERYVKATGGRLSVNISGVIPGSAAAAAGLMAGDDILSYDNRRTMRSFSLQMATVQGDRGEPVVVEFERNGQRMSVTVPRGPLGVQN